MSNPHTEALMTKHANLHARIDAEEHRRVPDMDRLAQMKREKLRLKDELVGH